MMSFMGVFGGAFWRYFLSVAKSFSMGFKSGEYGGRNRIWWPYLWAIFVRSVFEWKRALSQMIVEFSRNSLQSISLNHWFTSAVLAVPSKVMGASH